MRAIGTPLPGEEGSARPRAVLAALCLADGPNVSDEGAQRILASLVSQVGPEDGMGLARTSLDEAVMALTSSEWSQRLARLLVDAFLDGTREGHHELRGLAGMLEDARRSGEGDGWLGALPDELASDEPFTAIRAALALMNRAFRYQVGTEPSALLGREVEQLTRHVLPLLDGPPAAGQAAAWALYWLHGGRADAAPVMAPDRADRLTRALAREASRPETLRYLAHLVRNGGAEGAVPALTARLAHSDVSVRTAVAETLGIVGGEAALAALAGALSDPDRSVRRASLGGLAQSCRDEIDRRLLSREYADGPWLDPAAPITGEHVEDAARNLGISPDEVRRRYEGLAGRFGLKLAWQPGAALEGPTPAVPAP